ncbi:MAG: hypothetical protein ACREGG_03435, partial [Candidatus Saccharimonadales bacterium]
MGIKSQLASCLDGKRNANKRSWTQGQNGMASIVVVSVLIIVLTLITVGFTRLINRAVNNSANRQFSSAANYADQSGINDLASYIKTHTNTYVTQCNGSNSLIGDATNPGPFYDDSNLSNDPNRSAQYTCLLADTEPSSLLYTQVDDLKSQVVKVLTSAGPGLLDKLMISWQPSNHSITGYPPSGSCSKFCDETTWNDGTNNFVPMLRLS